MNARCCRDAAFGLKHELTFMLNGPAEREVEDGEYWSKWNGLEVARGMYGNVETRRTRIEEWMGGEKALESSS